MAHYGGGFVVPLNGGTHSLSQREVSLCVSDNVIIILLQSRRGKKKRREEGRN